MGESDAPREAFLEAVRRATRESRGSEPPAIDEAVLRTSSPGVDLVDRFEEAAGRLGVVIHRVDADGLRPAIAARLGDECSAVLEPALVERYPDLAGLGVTTPTDDELYAARYGITGVEFAVAETGSIVVASGEGRPRLFSLVPPVHLAVVDERQIVPDLLDVLTAQSGGALPANFVVITGPSRTADIAQRLVLGVHGPGEVECFVVGGDA